MSSTDHKTIRGLANNGDPQNDARVRMLTSLYDSLSPMRGYRTLYKNMGVVSDDYCFDYGVTIRSEEGLSHLLEVLREHNVNYDSNGSGLSIIRSFLS